MPGIEHGFDPEAAARQDLMNLAIQAQAEILKRLPDDEARMRWVAENAAEFRTLIEKDASFRDLAKNGDVDAMEDALKRGPLH